MATFYTPGIVLPYVPVDNQRGGLTRAQGAYQGASAQVQVIDRASWQWRLDYPYKDLSDTDKLALHSFQLRARGLLTPLLVPDLTHPTPVGSWEDSGLLFSDYEEAHPVLDASEWSIDNAVACRIHSEPRALRITSKLTNVATTAIVSYGAGFTVPASTELTVRVAARGVYAQDGGVGDGNFRLRFGTNPGSVNLDTQKINSEGYYTYVLGTHAQTTIYPSLEFTTQSMRAGEATIVDRIEVFKGAWLSSWATRNTLALADTPDVARLQAGSRVEVLGTLQGLPAGTIETAANRAVLRIEPGLPNSFSPTSSYQLCPYLPHGRFRLASGAGYGWQTNAVNYDSFTLSFLSAE